MGQPLKYELLTNNGAGNEDCLIIAIGKSLRQQQDISEKELAEQGWKAIENGLETLPHDQLKTLRSSLFHGYKDLFDEIEQGEIEDTEDLRSNVKSMVAKLKATPNIKKSDELLLCISDEDKAKIGLKVVAKSDLEIPGYIGNLFIDLDNSIKNKKPLQFIVCNDAHFSNLQLDRSNSIDINGADTKETFVTLMGTISDGTSFTHPKQMERVSQEENRTEFLYDEEILDSDLKELIKVKSDNLSKKDFDNIKEESLENFDTAHKEDFDDINYIYTATKNIRDGTNEIQEIQKKLDQELAWELQEKEFTEFNSENQNAAVDIEKGRSQTEPMMIFMDQRLKSYAENKPSGPSQNL